MVRMREMNETQATDRTLLAQALRALAALDPDYARERNSAGFNMFDGPLGHALAATPPEQWTAEETRRAWVMLKKYRKQLALIGINYDAIPEPPDPAARRAPEVTHEQGVFVIRFRYDADQVYMIKQVPGARWEPLIRAWCVPAAPHAAPALAAWIDRWGATLSPEAQALLDELRTQASCAGADAQDGAPAAQRQEAAVTIDQSGVFLVRFPYDPDLVARIKQVPGARWDRMERVWRVPAAAGAAPALTEFCRQAGLSVDDAAGRRLTELTHAAAANQEASRAAAPAGPAQDLLRGLPAGLFPFQQAGVLYALTNERTFIADAMGLGKTAQALATIQAAGAVPALVIVPASLKLNWQREAARWAAGRRVLVLAGRQAPDPEALDAGEIVIVNYDVLADGWQEERYIGARMRRVRLSPLGQALAGRPWRAVICDESHYLKSPDAQRARAVREIVRRTQPRYRLLLSGTPLVNRPVELVSQLDILGRLEEFGGRWAFLQRYCGATLTRFGWDVSGATHLEELNERLRASCYIRRTKEQVLAELPPKRRAVITVDLENRAEYERAEADLIGWLQETCPDDPDKISAALRAEQLVRIERLKQLAARGKLRAVREWIENFLESGEKLVIFASHVDIQRAVLEAFPGCARILGDDPVHVRQENVDRFQTDPDCRLIICSLAAGGVGITLTAASNVAFLELGWTPAVMDQAEDRTHRIGQRESVTAWYLLAEHTIDGEIWQLLERKRAVVEAATDGQAGRQQEDVLPELVQALLRRTSG